MRSLSVAFFIIVFTTITVVFSSLHVFPMMDDTAYGYVGTEQEVANITATTTQLNAQTSGTTTDLITVLFQQVGFNILTAIGTIARSVLYVQDIIARFGFPPVIGWAIQSLIWVVYGLDGLTMWRGIPW